jgi:predicted dehydrogenase
MVDGAGVGIIGCGLVGRKRAAALGRARLAACADLDPEAARSLAERFGATPYSDWRRVLDRTDVEIVVISTTNEALAPIAGAAVQAGKHVLVEKPAARRAHELESVMAAAAAHQRLVRVGFNHRYHPALQKAHELIGRAELGELMFLRGRYGHGGRLGYEKEWRADPARSGGGELIDQGVHLIDLARWFLGDFSDITGFARTYFWEMPVDDNAFLLLRTPSGRAAHLHVSCTEWRNLFSLEIYGRAGKLEIEGLGGSYGMERLAFHRMLPEMGPPESTVWEYRRGDDSWGREFAEFLEDIRLGRSPLPGLADASAALQVVERIYALS